MIKGFTLGEIIIPDGVFLGAQELTRYQLFLLEKIRLLFTFGGKGILTKQDFLVQSGPISGTISIPESLAIDNSGNLIYKREALRIEVPEGKNWIGCRFNKTSYEKGTISLSIVDGVSIVTGVETEFTKLFRGVVGQYKVMKICFEKANVTEGSLKNQGIYTVLQVINDTQLILAETVYPENELLFKPIQTFSQDLLPNEDQRSIYKNYGCDLILVPEVVSGQKPDLPSSIQGQWEVDIFCIASVENIGGSVTVIDRRETFYTKLEEFASPNQWEPLTLSSNFSQDIENPLSIRISHFSDKMEIKGKFKTSSDTGVICQLPEKYRPLFEVVVRFIKEEDSSEGFLKIDTLGQIQLLLTGTTYSDQTNNNYIYPQIVTIR